MSTGPETIRPTGFDTVRPAGIDNSRPPRRDIVRRVRAAWFVTAVLTIATVPALAGQAPVINASVEHRSIGSGGLAREVQSIAQRGTRVDMLRGRGIRLDSSPTCCGRCRLQPPTELVVLARVESRAIVELRPVAVDCDIDAGGAPLVWFDNARAEDSISWLSGR